jgi:hypothetical protein
MTLREDLMFSVNMPAGFSTPISKPVIGTTTQNLEWKLHVFDDSPVVVSASQISIADPSSPYTSHMTGTTWDAFMNQPGAVAIRQQQALFMEMRERFYAEYEGKYVAFSDGEILDSDTDDSALLVRTRELRRQKHVLVIRVQREYPPIEL